MQVIYDLRQALLRFIYALHIGEIDAVRGFHIHLGVAFAHIKGQGVGTAHSVHQLPGHKLSDTDEQHQGKDPAQQETQNGRCLLHNFAAEHRSGFMEAVYPAGVLQNAGLVNLGSFLVRKDDLVFLDVHLTDVFLLGHGHKGTIVHFFDLPLHNGGHGKEVEQHQHHQDDTVVVY